MSYTFYTATLGCKINQYETQALREVWLARGFSEVETAAEADVVLVNSCAVTASAVSDVRAAVRKSHRENPEAAIVVTGCAAQVMREELATLEGVTHVVPQESKASLKKWPDLPEGYIEPDEAAFPDLSVSNYNRSRAVVKVQDGCSHRCTYCIVPLTRGRSRSRAVDDIVNEARTLIESGFRELILSGVNLRQFGRDLEATQDFWDLVGELDTRLPEMLGDNWPEQVRFRISSLEPGQLGDNALKTLEKSRIIAPQLHISLQSGSDSVLKRMGRGHYKAQPLLNFLDDLRSVWPIYGLGADILMGFPAETEEEFAQTLDYVQRMPLTYAHVFPYSTRPGTAAAGMPDQLDKETKKRRAKAVRDVVSAKQTAFREMLVQSAEPLKVVLQSGTSRKGISEYYNDCRFEALPVGAVAREIYAAVPVAVEKGTLIVRAK